MTTLRFATSRPAALTGRVGQSGDNRVHDVTLVQALLGQKRDRKSNRPYLRNHVTGKYDKFTAEALMRFRMDQRDGNMRQPLARSGPTLNKLAQGQSLTVLEGTNISYKTATLAEPGEIKGEAAKLLSAERKVELKAVMKDFISEWGIALDVEIKVAANNLPARTERLRKHYDSMPLAAHFTPRNFWVDSGAGLSHVPNNTQFRAKAKALYEIVAADLKARCVEVFGITDPVDVKIQNGLKDDLACVVRTDLEGVVALAQFYLADFRKKGFTLAVRFLERYLEANGGKIELSREEALTFDEVQDAAAVNIERFWQDNLIEPKSKDPHANEAVEAITKGPDVGIQAFDDHWVRGIPSKALENLLKSMFGLEVDPLSGSLGFGAGGSNVTSRGAFFLKRTGNRIVVTVSVRHIWSDPGFDFNKDQPFREESQVLERHKRAKPFLWEATWDDRITGELEVLDPFTPKARLREIVFEVRPAS